MYATPANVRNCSYSGEFSELADGVILAAIEEASIHYGSSVDRGASVALVTWCEALHAAHLLHMGMIEEAGEEAEGAPGPVKSASLAGVGSWSFDVQSQAPQQGEGKGPIPDWKASPYGKRWRIKYDALPVGITAVPGVML
jgi:hypothetical protein